MAENGRTAHVETVKAGQPVLQSAIERLRESGLSLDEIRRLFDAELLRQSGKFRTRK